MNEEIKQPAILQRLEILGELIGKLERKLAPVTNNSPIAECEDRAIGESLAMERIGLLCSKVEKITTAVDIS